MPFRPRPVGPSEPYRPRPRSEQRPHPPITYTSEGVHCPVGAIVGDPTTFTYRVCWSQAIPRTMEFWLPEILPTVAMDRTIIVRHGHSEPNAWGVPHILSIVALQTPAVCCVNIHSECYTHARHIWWYCRISDDEMRTIDWDELTRKECDLLTAAVRSHALRGLVRGRSAEHRRSPIIYKYPWKGKG